MSLRRNLLTVALLSSALLSACALRPRYNDIVQANGVAALQENQLVVLRVTDAETGQPVKGAKILGGEYRNHLNSVSDENGEFSLQLDPGLVKENPLVEVVLPKGVSRYKLQVVPSGQAPAPEGAPITAPAEPAPESSATPATPGAPSETPAEPTPDTATSK